MKEVVCTVLVAAYNAERYIGECLDSLVAQTQPGMEMIVIDDASEDGTADIVRSYVVRHSNISLITLSANDSLPYHPCAQKYTLALGRKIFKRIQIAQSETHIGVPTIR